MVTRCQTIIFSPLRVNSSAHLAEESPRASLTVTLNVDAIHTYRAVTETVLRRLDVGYFVAREGHRWMIIIRLNYGELRQRESLRCQNEGQQKTYAMWEEECGKMVLEDNNDDL
jgi:hypothetical protein